MEKREYCWPCAKYASFTRLLMARCSGRPCNRCIGVHPQWQPQCGMIPPDVVEPLQEFQKAFVRYFVDVRKGGSHGDSYPFRQAEAARRAIPHIRPNEKSPDTSPKESPDQSNESSPSSTGPSLAAPPPSPASTPSSSAKKLPSSPPAELSGLSVQARDEHDDELEALKEEVNVTKIKPKPNL